VDPFRFEQEAKRIEQIGLIVGYENAGLCHTGHGHAGAPLSK
jgi:hypothetical protein